MFIRSIVQVWNPNRTPYVSPVSDRRIFDCRSQSCYQNFEQRGGQ